MAGLERERVESLVAAPDCPRRQFLVAAKRVAIAAQDVAALLDAVGQPRHLVYFGREQKIVSGRAAFVAKVARRAKYGPTAIFS